MTGRTYPWQFGAVVLVLVLSGCADTRDQSLCDQAADLQATVQELRDLDPATATADQVRDLVDQLVLDVQQLRAAADSTIETAASNAQSAFEDLRRSLSDLSADNLDIARPLIEDAYEDAVTAYNTLEQKLETGCNLT